MRPTLVAAALIIAPAVFAQDTPPPTPCATTEHRQFDFWVGRWEVTDADGQVVGHNRIEPVYSGCGLREEWSSANGWRGGSLNLYDEARGRWHQTWIDQSGRLLLLDGGLDGSTMVLSGTAPSRDAREILHEIRWTPLDDGRVRQHWRTSRDGGVTWEDAFLGLYERE
jgi:hypothetical protein